MKRLRRRGCLEHNVGLLGLAAGANRVHVEADLGELLDVEEVPAVEDKGRLLHGSVDGLKVECAELLPLSEHNEGVRAVHGCLGVGVRRDGGEVALDVLVSHLGVVDVDIGVLVDKEANDFDGAGLARVASVGLEGKAEDAELLSAHSAVHGLEDARGKALLLELVDLHNALPVARNLVQLVALADVDQREDVLLEAGATEANRRAQVAAANAVVHAQHSADVAHVSASLLAESRDGVDGADALGEEGVARQLGELARPEVGGHDLFARHPVGVDLGHLGDGSVASSRLLSSDEDAVRHLEVVDSRSLCEELGVANDLE
mmetsp:Transcript_8530/g.35580  ORF Transcript_8530/g.35580 Transcript_8530/m.35580 type:complete len:319 (+) Transcript_8530:29-985(+)